MAPSSAAAKAKPVVLAPRSTLVRRDSRNLSNPPAVPSQTLPSRSSRPVNPFDVGPVRPSVTKKMSAEAPLDKPWRSRPVESLRRRRPAGVDIHKVPSRSMKPAYIGPIRGSASRIQSLLALVVSDGTYKARMPLFVSFSHRVPSGPSRNLISPSSLISVVARARCPGCRNMIELSTAIHRVPLRSKLSVLTYVLGKPNSALTSTHCEPTRRLIPRVVAAHTVPDLSCAKPRTVP